MSIYSDKKSYYILKMLNELNSAFFNQTILIDHEYMTKVKNSCCPYENDGVCIPRETLDLYFECLKNNN